MTHLISMVIFLPQPWFVKLLHSLNVKICDWVSLRGLLVVSELVLKLFQQFNISDKGYYECKSAKTANILGQ